MALMETSCDRGPFGEPPLVASLLTETGGRCSAQQSQGHLNAEPSAEATSRWESAAFLWLKRDCSHTHSAHVTPYFRWLPGLESSAELSRFILTPGENV